MKKKLILFLVFFIGIIIVTRYIFPQDTPVIVVHTEISELGNDVYENIGGLEKVKYPEQRNFKTLEFNATVHYPKNIQEVEFSMPNSFAELLSKDIYWTGNGWENHPENKRYSQYYHKAIIYVGEVTEEDIKNMLNKGYFNVYWKSGGEEKRKDYNIGQTLKFIK